MEHGIQKKIAALIKMDESMFSKRLRGRLPWPVRVARELEREWGISATLLVFGSPDEIRREFLRVFDEKIAA